MESRSAETRALGLCPVWIHQEIKILTKPNNYFLLSMKMLLFRNSWNGKLVFPLVAASQSQTVGADANGASSWSQHQRDLLQHPRCLLQCQGPSLTTHFSSGDKTAEQGTSGRSLSWSQGAGLKGLVRDPRTAGCAPLPRRSSAWIDLFCFSQTSL